MPCVPIGMPPTPFTASRNMYDALWRTSTKISRSGFVRSTPGSSPSLLLIRSKIASPQSLAISGDLKGWFPLRRLLTANDSPFLITDSATSAASFVIDSIEESQVTTGEAETTPKTLAIIFAAFLSLE